MSDYDRACSQLAQIKKDIDRLEAIQDFRRTEVEKYQLRTAKKEAKKLELEIKQRFQPRLL